MKKIILSLFLIMVVLASSGCQKDNVAAATQKDATVITVHEQAMKIVQQMSLEEKIGQMLFIGIQGSEIDSGAVEMLQNYHVGGVILFDRNMLNQYQVTGLNANLQRINAKYNKLPLYIAVDQEGGAVARMSNDLEIAPPAAVIAKEGTIEDAYMWAQKTAVGIKALGFNVNFAPVLDIALPYQRSYGVDVQTIQKFTEAVCSAYEDAGIIYSIKHFPGIGKSLLDPHEQQFAIDVSKNTLLKEDVQPFQNIITKFNNDNFMVMVGHLQYPQLDVLPASVSPKIAHNLLREELGFKGLVITDDMEMGALTEAYTFEEMGKLAAIAGVNLLLVCHDYEHEKQVYQGVLKAIKSGELSQDNLDRLVTAIVKNKLEKLMPAEVKPVSIQKKLP